MADPPGIVPHIPDFQVDFSTERYSNIPEGASPYYPSLQGPQGTDYNRPAYAPTPVAPGPYPMNPPYPVGPLYPVQPVQPPYPVSAPLPMGTHQPYPVGIASNNAPNQDEQFNDYEPEPHQHFDQPIASPDIRDNTQDQGGNGCDRIPSSPVNEPAPVEESGDTEPACEEAAVGTQTEDDLEGDEGGVQEGGEQGEENDKSGDGNEEGSGENEVSGENETVSGEKETGSGETETVSGENEAGSGENETVSGENETVSGEKETVSGENETVSGENEAGSGEKETGSGENETPQEVTEKTAEVQTEDNDQTDGVEEKAAENPDKSEEVQASVSETDKDKSVESKDKPTETEDNVEKSGDDNEKNPEKSGDDNEKNPEKTAVDTDEKVVDNEKDKGDQNKDNSEENNQDKEASSETNQDGETKESQDKEPASSEAPAAEAEGSKEATSETTKDTTNEADGDSDDIIVTGEDAGRQSRRTSSRSSQRVVLGTMRSATLNEAAENGDSPGVVRVKQEPDPDGASYGSDGGLTYSSTGSWSQEDRRELTLEETLEVWKSGPCPVYGCRASGNYNQLHQRIRHYERLHAQFHVIFVCPVVPCGAGTERFQGKDLMSMNRHLKGPDHNLTPNQIAALRGSIESENIPNPDYLPPIYDRYCQVTYNEQEYSNVLGGNNEPTNHNIQYEDLPTNTDQLYEDVSDLLNVPPEAVDVWRTSKKCPVSNCKGPALTLKHFFDWHWYVFHEQLIKIYYCPVKGCKRGRERWNSRRRRDLVSHLTQRHKVDKLPDAIETQIVKNPNYKPPVNFGGSENKDNDTPAAAKKAPEGKGRNTRNKLPPMPSPTKGLEDASDAIIPPEFEQAWQKLKACPGCKTGGAMKFMSELKRHWKAKHVKHTSLYVCPDGNCQMDMQGKKVQYRHKDMKSMQKHLTGPSHMLSEEEAKQIGEAIAPTLLDNPQYVEPVLAPPPPPPTPKAARAAPKPKATPTPKPAAQTPPTTTGRRTRGRQVEPSAESDTGSEVSSTSQSRTRSSLADYRLPASLAPKNTTPKASTPKTPTPKTATSKTATPKTATPKTPTRKRGRAAEETPEESTPTKQAREADVSLTEDSENFDSNSDVVPPGFLEWWSNRDGCPSIGCSGAVCKFTIHDLVRHWKSCHIPVVPFYQCPKADCEYSSKSKKNLISHLSKTHKLKAKAAEDAKSFWQDNPDYQEPILPTKKNSPAKFTGRKPPKERGVVEKPETTLQPTVDLERYDNGDSVVVTPQRGNPSPAQTSRSGRGRSSIATPQSGGRSTRGNPKDPSPTPEPSPGISRSGKRRARSEPQDDSLQEPAWQPKVCLVPLPHKYATSGVVSMAAIRNVNLSPTTRQLPAPKKKAKLSPVKVNAASLPPPPALTMPHVTFEADDYDDDDNDNFGVEIPMPSMDDAGIAISILPGRKSSPNKPGSKSASSAAGGSLSELEVLKQKQLELERRLEQTTNPALDADVLKQISSLQAQNEALRFQNQALRSQLMSGEMAKQWADEKAKLEQQLSNKDVTIGTLQDVISRLSNQNSTNNNITNQMINLPGSDPMSRATRSAARITNPEQRMAIKPHAGPSHDGTLQNCSVSLKSGASVNFQYDSFSDFMQKIGTLNDQYSLNN